ncbi:MAG: NAD(P)/FAD-dependent oxidoreductase, partial [Alphaproteobacteria bacterium]
MKAAVVGCGIAGMASAIGLSRRGHEVTLFETFKTPRPLGSGLLLQPSGLAALRHLGLEDEVRAAGARVDRLDGRDRSGRRILDLDYGRWRKGTHGIGVNRHDLFTLLFDAAKDAGINIITATPITAVDDFDRPRLRSEAGEVFDGFDLAVIADGSGSRLREQIRPNAKAPVYPWGAVWTNCPDPGQAFSGALRQLYDGVGVMIGALPLGGGQVSFFWSLPVAEHDGFFTQDFQAWKDMVANLWPDASPLLAGVTSAEGFSRAVYRDVTVGRWTRGACVLIGDAAHG